MNRGLAMIAAGCAVLGALWAANPNFPSPDPDLRVGTPDDPGYDCDEPDSEDGQSCDGDLFGEHLSLFGFAPEATRLSATYKDLARLGQPQISGSSVDAAWKRTIGDPRVIIAVTDTGVRWDNTHIRKQVWLNRFELPMPEGGPNPDDALFGGYDVNGDGQFDVDDYAGDSRVDITAGGRPDLIDGQDLIRAFSDGVDDDGNGYVDDIAGWDFFEDDNDPDDTTSYSSARNHGTGRMREAAETTNDAQGEAGVCPRCRVMPLRIWDTFVVPGDQWAAAVVFAADHGALVQVTANGMLQNTPTAKAANRYAYDRGMALMHVSSDLNTANHNYPTNYIESIYINGCAADLHGGSNEIVPDNPLTGGVSGTAPIQTWFRNSNLTQYGAHAHVCWTAVTGSEATGHAGGAAGLIHSLGLQLADQIGGPLSANEVKQLLTMTAEDVLPENTGGTGTPDPAQPGFDEHFGYGRAHLGDALARIAEGRIPPEVLIERPAWWAIVDPVASPTAPLVGRVAARRSSDCRYVAQWAVGIEPTEYVEFASGPCPDGEAVLGELPMQAIADAIGPHSRDGSVPPATPGGRPDINAHMFTVRVQAVDADGNVGEDRRVYLALHDPTAMPGWPKFVDVGGESSPTLYDLDGDGRLEIVEADSGGALCAWRHDGSLLPSFNAGRCWQLPPTFFFHPQAPGFASGAVPPPTSGLRSPAIADVDGDFEPEIVVAAGDGRVFVISAHGEVERELGIDPANSTPDQRNAVDHPKRGILGSPLITDLDQDGGRDIVVAALDGFLYVWDGASGQARPGFPRAVREDPRPDGLSARGELIYTPVVAQLDDDPELEIVTGSSDVIPNAPQPPSSPPPPPTAGSGTLVAYMLDNLAGGQSRVYAFNADGSFVDGWPVALTGLLPDVLPLVGPQHGIAAGDLDGDGRDEIVASMTTGDVVILRGDGSRTTLTSQGAINGGASSESSRILNLFEASVVGDIDGRGGLDIVHVGVSAPAAVNLLLVGQNFPFNHVVQAWDSSNPERYLPGYPTAHDDYGLLSQAAIANVDGSGAREIVVGSGLYLLHAYDGATGLDVAGFPKQTGGWLFAVPAIGDIDADGLLELVAGTREGWRFAWKLDAPALPEHNSEWWMESHDECHTNRHGADCRPPNAVRALGYSGGQLRFVAPGDDWGIGMPSHYELRTLDRPILDAEDWSAAAVLPMHLATQPAGGTETIALPAERSLGHVAVVAVDDAGNRSRPVSTPVAADTAAPPPLRHTLRITVIGEGRVTEPSAGLVCTANRSCTRSYLAGSTVTLRAEPGAGQVFTGWTGDCSGSGDCSLVIGRDTSVTAGFAPQPPQTDPQPAPPAGGHPDRRVGALGGLGVLLLAALAAVRRRRGSACR